MLVFAGIGIANQSSGSIQKQRQDYCLNILEPEACQVLTEDGSYRDPHDCVVAMNDDGVCDLPIRLTLGQMQDCVLELRNSDVGDPIPRNCLMLVKVP